MQIGEAEFFATELEEFFQNLAHKYDHMKVLNVVVMVREGNHDTIVDVDDQANVRISMREHHPDPFGALLN